MIEKISDLRLFRRIAELGNLTAAAGDIGLSPGSASLRLAAMERGIGAALFRRTTRQMHLTEAGAEFLEIANRVLEELNNFDESIAQERRAISGRVRITAPVDIGRNFIAPTLDAFQQENPGISIDLICTDSIVDLTECGVDIAMRYGNLSDSAMRVRRISSNRRIPVASHDYLSRKGVPKTPRDLMQHNCILLTAHGDRNATWRFVDNGKVLTVRVGGQRTTNDGEIARRWALQGHGIALKSAWDVAHDFTTGGLIPLLASYCSPNVDLQLLFQPARRQPARVKRLADYLVERLKTLDACLASIDLDPVYQPDAKDSQAASLLPSEPK